MGMSVCSNNSHRKQIVKSSIKNIPTNVLTLLKDTAVISRKINMSALYKFILKSVVYYVIPK